MKLNIYRWAKLSEALKMLDGSLPHKYLYRITDKSEAEFYAYQNKIVDKNGWGSIIQAQINIKANDIKQLTNEEYNKLDQPWGKRIIQNKIGAYDTDQFRVLFVPPKLHHHIHDIEVTKVV
jgi:hypothetical protein